MSLSGLQSSWSPALNSGGGGGGGGSSITNGTAPTVGTVNITPDGVVVVSSTNETVPDAGSIFLETTLANHVVISPTVGNTTSVSGPVLFTAGAYSGANSYGKGSLVTFANEYFVASQSIPQGASPPGGDWTLLASPSTIGNTTAGGLSAQVTTLLGDVAATADRNIDMTATNDAQITADGQIGLTANGGGIGINSTAGVVVINASTSAQLIAQNGFMELTTGDGSMTLTSATTLTQTSDSMIVNSANTIDVTAVAGAMTLTSGIGGITINSGIGPTTVISAGMAVNVLDTNTIVLSTGPVPTPPASNGILLSAGNTDFYIHPLALVTPPGPGSGLVITPTQIFFNGRVL